MDPKANANFFYTICSQTILLMKSANQDGVKQKKDETGKEEKRERKTEYRA